MSGALQGNTEKTLSTSQVRQFRKQGFIVLPGLLDVVADLGPLIAEYRELAAHLCRAYAPEFVEEDFDIQLGQLFRQMGGLLHHHLDICLPQKGVAENSSVHTGRPSFPGFVARCGTGSGQVLDSASEWTALWDAARQQMIDNPPDSFQRWPDGNPDCA